MCSVAAVRGAGAHDSRQQLPAICDAPPGNDLQTGCWYVISRLCTRDSSSRTLRVLRTTTRRPTGRRPEGGPLLRRRPMCDAPEGPHPLRTVARAHTDRRGARVQLEVRALIRSAPHSRPLTVPRPATRSSSAASHGWWASGSRTTATPRRTRRYGRSCCTCCRTGARARTRSCASPRRWPSGSVST